MQHYCVLALSDCNSKTRLTIHDAESSDDSAEKDKIAQVNEWFTNLTVLLFTNFDGTQQDYDVTTASLFRSVIDSIEPVQKEISQSKLQSDYILFYQEIIQAHLDDKERLETVGKEMICRDICPRHLLDDMRSFGQDKL